MNAIQKRHKQKLDWRDSDTNKAPALIRNAKKIGFDDGVKFLAACRNVDIDEMEAILSRGIDIDVSNSDGLTALHRACLNNDLEVAQFLVEKGADMNRPDNEGMTPLHDAIINGYLEIIKYLVDKGAQLDALNHDNELPIDMVDEGDTEVKKYLTKCMEDRGIDPEAVKRREQHLMLTDAQQWFQDGNYTPPIDRFTKATPLHIAASKNYFDVMTILLQIPNVDVNAVDKDGWTPLHSAAHWGHKEACELLLKKGADINARTYTNQSVMDVASSDLEDFLKDASTKVGSVRRLSRPSHRLSTSEKQFLITKSLAEEGKTLRDSGIFDTSISSSIPPVAPTEHVKETTIPPASANDREGATNTVAAETKTQVPDLSTLPTKEMVPPVSTTATTTMPKKTPLSFFSASTPNLYSTSINTLDEVETLSDDDPSPVELRLKRPNVLSPEESAIFRMSAVLAPEKGEKEAQRTSKARHARASRRSTQGVSLEDLNTAKTMNSIPAPAPSSQSPSISTKTSVQFSSNAQGDPGKSSPTEETADTTVILRKSGEVGSTRTSMRSSLLDEEDESIDLWVKRRRQHRVGHSHSTKDHEMTTESSVDSTVSIPDSRKTSPLNKTTPSSDLTDALSLSASPSITSTNNIVRVSSDLSASFEFVKPLPPPPLSKLSHFNSTLPSTGVSSSPLASPFAANSLETENSAENFEALYRRTLAEKEQLEREIIRLQGEREASDRELARLRQIQINNRPDQTPSFRNTDYEEMVKELKTLKEENAKMKEENVALVKVVRRLSNPYFSPSTPPGSASSNMGDYRA